MILDMPADRKERMNIMIDSKGFQLDSLTQALDISICMYFYLK